MTPDDHTVFSIEPAHKDPSAAGAGAERLPHRRGAETSGVEDARTRACCDTCGYEREVRVRDDDVGGDDTVLFRSSGPEWAPPGYPAPMTEPDRPLSTSLADVAREDPAESVAREREAVGDQPDTGGLVPPDDAQSAPPA